MVDVGVALRSEIFEPRLIAAMAPKLDQLGFRSVWYPDVAGYDSLELAALSLGATRNVYAATGVLRFHENQPATVARRVNTIQQASGGRLILGVGTGAMRGADAVRGLENWIHALRKLVDGNTKVFVAALRKPMFRSACGYADGVVLNFCSPDHVRRLLGNTRNSRNTPIVACYIKLFYAKKDFAARKMFVDEFLKYDSYPHYHGLFEQLGVAQTLQALRENPAGSVDLEPLFPIARYNPTIEDVEEMVRGFTSAGVDLPIIYPYVEGDGEYKVSVLDQLAQLTRRTQ
jgi:hypothetical protein